MKSITTRQKKIIRTLCTEKEFITTSQIANELQVSGKTIQRELGNVDKWLDKKGIQLEKRTRYGLRIIASKLEREKLLEAINEEDGIMIFSQRDRRILNLLELLKQKEPIKLYALSRNLNVSENTISNDLDKLEEYLGTYNLLLIKKPGVGVYLQGEEIDIRRISIDLMHENIEIRKLVVMGEDSIIGDLSRLKDYVKKRVLDLVDISYLHEIDEIVKELEEDMDISFVETSYANIIIHMLLMLERVRMNEPFQLSPDLEEDLKKSKEWALATIIKDKIKEKLNIILPKEEMAYMAIHLRGVKKYNSPLFNENITSENLRIIKLAKDMIKLTETEIGMFLDEDGELFAALVYHLIAVISRVSMNLPIRNPVVEQIKDHYPKVFQIASQCAQLIEERFLVTVPQTEIGYIAMHLGGAIVRVNSINERVYQVVISCVLGIGSSGLMKSRIEKEFPNIRVNAVRPIEDIKNDYLKDSTVDFVISTVEVSSRYKPSICVNPILSQEDITRIQELIVTLPQKSIPLGNSEKMTDSSAGKIDDLRELIEGVGSVLNNFYIHQYEEVVTLEEIIQDVGGILGEKEEQKESIKTALREREKHGSTILSKEKAMLLHCRTDGVYELHFEVVRMKKSIQIEEQKNKSQNIDLILLMVVPQKCSENYLGIMRHISQMLIEKKDFIVSLREKEFNDLKSHLNKMLLRYYQGKI